MPAQIFIIITCHLCSKKLVASPQGIVPVLENWNKEEAIEKDDIEILKSLKSESSIIISRPDEGRGVVIQDKNSYIEKMEVILEDRSKFHRVEGDIHKIIMSLEEKLNRIIRPLRDQIGAATYDYVRASGSLPGVMYGLVKVHKPNFPIRPIISSINTFSYYISKFLASFLYVMTINEYTIRKTSEFIDNIRELKFNSDVVLASFDVESLFTNIPLSVTCDIIENNLHQGNYNLPIKIELFVKLLKIAVIESFPVQFSKYYNL